MKKYCTLEDGVARSTIYHLRTFLSRLCPREVRPSRGLGSMPTHLYSKREAPNRKLNFARYARLAIQVVFVQAYPAQSRSFYQASNS